MNSLEDRESLDTLREGFRRVGLTFPYLIGLIGKLRVQLDRRVSTMGIFASGRMVANPDFVRTLLSSRLLFFALLIAEVGLVWFIPGMLLTAAYFVYTYRSFAGKV